jgi:hypothetical protein
MFGRAQLASLVRPSGQQPLADALAPQRGAAGPDGLPIAMAPPMTLGKITAVRLREVT